MEYVFNVNRNETTEPEPLEQELTRARDLLATTLASIGDGVIATDPQGRITFLNPEAERLTGWKSAEAAGRPLPEVFRVLNENSRQPVENPVEKVLQRGAVVGMANHTILLSKTGAEIAIDDSAAPIRQPGGQLEGVILIFRDVSEQRKAQHARARLAAIVEFSGDVILTKTLDGIIQTWNASAERLFGYKAEEVIGKHITILFPPDRLKEEDYILSRLRQGKPAERFETIRVAKNGRPIPVLVSVSPLKDAHGEVIGASKIIHDISDLVAARNELSREKELLATTLASIGDAVIVTDPQGRINFLNAEAERLTGWNNSEASGHNLPEVFRIVNEDSRRSVENPVEKVMRLGTVVGLANHTLLLSRNGREIPIDDSAAPIRQADGPLFGIVLVFRDFTESKRTAQALAEGARQQSALYRLVDHLHSAESFGDIYDAALEAIVTALPCDRASILLYDNAGVMRFAASRRLSDEYRKAVEGHSPWKSDDPDPQPVTISDVAAAELPEPLKTVITREGIEACAFVPLVAGGKLIGKFMSYYNAAHSFTAQEMDLCLNIARQLAVSIQRRSAEEALRAREAELERTLLELKDAHAQLGSRAVHLEKVVEERTAKLKDMVNEMQHVSYAMVHDMRAPLRAMSTFADALLQEFSETQTNEDVRDYCSRIIAAANRLDKLIQDSLNYTKAVLQESPLQAVDLSRLLPSLIETYPNLHTDRADISIEDPLPVVMGEESLLTQCFSNLLGNAVKFVAPGVRPRIRIHTQILDEFARVTVEDNGIGISPPAQSRLFGMFQRLTSGYEGTGIGLAIVRKVVERMGGKVGAESEVGKGSSFWVELRLASAAA